MNAVIYCRSAQFDETGIENQKALAIKYAEEQGYTIIHIISDNGVSGMEKKTGVAEIIRLAEDGKIAVVICRDISRLGRNTIRRSDTVKQLSQCGVNIEFFA